VAGYVAAFLVASAALAIRLAQTSGPDAQASSGMYAFGDMFLFLGVFGVIALVPTGAALFFLRSRRILWIVLSVVALAVALTGVAAMTLYVVGRTADTRTALGVWAGLSPLRILAAPFFTLGFFMSGVISPHRFPRMALLLAAFFEAAVSACAWWLWFSLL